MAYSKEAPTTAEASASAAEKTDPVDSLIKSLKGMEAGGKVYAGHIVRADPSGAPGTVTKASAGETSIDDMIALVKSISKDVPPGGTVYCNSAIADVPGATAMVEGGVLSVSTTPMLSTKSNTAASASGAARDVTPQES